MRLGGEALFRQVTGSTNDDALMLARLGAPEGTVVVADYQTSGRGRRGRRWIAPPGSAALISLILRPNIPPDMLPLITLASSSAVARAISRMCDLKPRLKWPNDVTINGRKAAGVLLESFEGGRLAILGIGVNVNLREEELPPHPKGGATSLNLEVGREVDRFELIELILAELEARYKALKRWEFDAVLSEYRLLCSTLGREVEVEEGGVRFRGMAIDLGEKGELIVALPDGRLRRVFDGEVSVYEI